MWLLMYLRQIISALWGVHHSYRVGPAGYRRSRSGAASICKMLATVRIMRAFHSPAERVTYRPIPTDRPTDHDPRIDWATTSLTYTPSRAHVPFFNSRITCICERLNIGRPGRALNYCGVVVLRTLINRCIDNCCIV